MVAARWFVWSEKISDAGTVAWSILTWHHKVHSRAISLGGEMDRRSASCAVQHCGDLLEDLAAE